MDLDGFAMATKELPANCPAARVQVPFPRQAGLDSLTPGGQLWPRGGGAIFGRAMATTGAEQAAPLGNFGFRHWAGQFYRI